MVSASDFPLYLRSCSSSLTRAKAFLDCSSPFSPSDTELLLVRIRSLSRSLSLMRTAFYTTPSVLTLSFQMTSPFGELYPLCFSLEREVSSKNILFGTVVNTLNALDKVVSSVVDQNPLFSNIFD